MFLCLWVVGVELVCVVMWYGGWLYCLGCRVLAFAVELALGVGSTLVVVFCEVMGAPFYGGCVLEVLSWLCFMVLLWPSSGVVWECGCLGCFFYGWVCWFNLYLFCWLGIWCGIL